MPPETPTATVRPFTGDSPVSTGPARRGAAAGRPLVRPADARSGLLRGFGLRLLFLVVVRHLALHGALERNRGHLAVHLLPGTARPLVEAARFARGDNRDFVLARAGGRNQGCQLRHENESSVR